MTRTNNRPNDALRPLTIETDVNKHAEGSCLICCGDTKVLCTASAEEKVPSWLKNTGSGWVTAEYGMLPRATGQRVEREAKRGQSGRTQEIQRLIGRALRAAVDLKALDGFCIKIDCDVIQADGGTRTASVTGGFVALYLACRKLVQTGKLEKLPITASVAAVSAGIIDGVPMLDLDYGEDSNAGVDANFVMTDAGRLVEIQGTAEHQAFSRDELNALLDLAQKGIFELMAKQKEVLGLKS